MEMIHSQHTDMPLRSKIDGAETHLYYTSITKNVSFGKILIKMASAVSQKSMVHFHPAHQANAAHGNQKKE